MGNTIRSRQKALCSVDLGPYVQECLPRGLAHPSHQLLKFGPTALYRDQMNRPVVADAEGQGTFRITGEGAQIWVDGEPGAASQGHFAASILVLGGAVQVEVELFPSPAPVRRLELVDSFLLSNPEVLKARRWQVQSISRLHSLSSSFEDGTELELEHASHMNIASWDLEVSLEWQGIVLAKVFDRFHGKQRARVWVDDVAAGYWFDPFEDRVNRWGISRFGIPPELLAGKTRVRIAIDPPSGVPLWDAAGYFVFALVT